MKLLNVLAVIGLSIGMYGCPKKSPTEPQAEPQKKTVTPAPPVVGTLPPDADYAAGKVEAAVMTMKTRVDAPGMIPEGAVDEDLKKAQENSFTTQRWSVSEHRGKLVFNTPDFIVPQGTELRYSPGKSQYVLVDPRLKAYWAMTGAEIGNLLEGGPSTQRSNYTVTVEDTKESETVAGFTAQRSNVALGFDWSVKTKAGNKQGKIKIKLAIWHTAEAALKPAWGEMMVDFLTFPFQDKEGKGVVDQLKSKLKFPVKWSMEVVNETMDKRGAGEVRPKFVTVAQKIEVKEIARESLALPPAGFNAARSPYEFGEGGQTIREELLAKIPAKKGAPPKAPEGK